MCVELDVTIKIHNKQVKSILFDQIADLSLLKRQMKSDLSLDEGPSP